MKSYKKPAVKDVLSESIVASGQYIFQFTPGECPGLSENGWVGQEGGYARCSGAIGGSFQGDITCANISGTYHVVYGDSVNGGGLDCGIGEQSIFYPELSVTPELPADCIVDSFIFQGGSNGCELN